MVAREERWRSGSQDGRPGRKMKSRERRMSGLERKKAAGKPENGPSRQNGRPGGQKTGGETKIAVRTTTFRAGTEKRRREDSKRGGERKNAAGILKTAAGR